MKFTPSQKKKNPVRYFYVPSLRFRYLTYVVSVHVGSGVVQVLRVGGTALIVGGGALVGSRFDGRRREGKRQWHGPPPMPCSHAYAAPVVVTTRLAVCRTRRTTTTTTQLGRVRFHRYHHRVLYTVPVPYTAFTAFTFRYTVSLQTPRLESRAVDTPSVIPCASCRPDLLPAVCEHRVVVRLARGRNTKDEKRARAYVATLISEYTLLKGRVAVSHTHRVSRIGEKSL